MSSNYWVVHKNPLKKNVESLLALFTKTRLKKNVESLLALFTGSFTQMVHIRDSNIRAVGTERRISLSLACVGSGMHCQGFSAKPLLFRPTDPQRQTEADRGRQRQTEADRDRDRDTPRDGDTPRETERETERER